MAAGEAAWAGVVPALLAALFAGWCGNLLGGATAAGSTTALAALLLVLIGFAGSCRDPWRLGRVWGWAPVALWLAVAASAWRSPVSRAGLAPVLLMPAYLCLPRAFAHCWSGEAARRLGARALAAMVGGMAAWSLAADHLPGLVAGVIAPLGHRPLLAAWLATLLPLAALPLRERTAWRWLGAAAVALSIAAIAVGRPQPVAADVPGRSLAGGAALVCEALLAAWWLARRRRASRWILIGGLALAGAVLAAFQLQRVRLILARQDPSALARAVYLRAGWQGWRERPWLGWGPGSVPWTAAWFLTPIPGINPWGEAVGELHSLPVHLAYETGALGVMTALAAGGAFARRRWLERRAASDPGWLAAGCIGLAGAGVASLGTAALAVAALPLALAIAAGAALAGGAPGARAAPAPGARVAPALRVSGPACVYGLMVLLGLLASEVARWHYDRAVRAGQAGRRQEEVAELTAAVRLDQAFPLYRMRLALLENGGAPDRAAATSALNAAPEQAATSALTAARDANGIGLLWLVAGILGRADGEVWARAAFEEGCSLDPFSPYPAFYLLVSEPGAPSAPRLGARALMAEPRLMAAVFWEGREPLFRRALEEVRGWPGVDAGWKLALLRAAPAPAVRRGPLARLALTIDGASFTQATSLHLFRRSPWPTVWPLISLRQELAASMRVPPATSLRPGRTEGKGTPFEKACLPES
jgi:O-Antigen ligase